MPKEIEQEIRRAGLCAECTWAQRVQSDRDETFWLCRRSFSDHLYSKYPRLPVLSCPGFEQESPQEC